jgi:hypothetical protein
VSRTFCGGKGAGSMMVIVLSALPLLTVTVIGVKPTPLDT